MGVIIIICPVTGKEIESGIETDPETFARISSIVGSVWCPHCKTEHEWKVQDAHIRRDNPNGSAS